MSEDQDPVNRRDFIAKSVAVAGALGAAKELLGKPGRSAASSGKVLGANDRVQIGIIGVGGRGSYLSRQFSEFGKSTNSCQIVAVADVYEKRKRIASDKLKCDGYLDYPQKSLTARISMRLWWPLRTIGTPPSRSKQWITAKTCTWKSPCATPSRRRGTFPRP